MLTLPWKPEPEVVVACAPERDAFFGRPFLVLSLTLGSRQVVNHGLGNILRILMAPLFLVAALLLTVYGQLIIKARAFSLALDLAGTSSRLTYLFSMLSDFRVISGIGAAAVAAVFWILAIERLEIGYAYPFMALSFVLVPLGSMALFGERMPPIQLVGVALIVAGVTLSALSR